LAAVGLVRALVVAVFTVTPAVAVEAVEAERWGVGAIAIGCEFFLSLPITVADDVDVPCTAEAEPETVVLPVTEPVVLEAIERVEVF
jgi:hypothetical protein